jgi:polar amino acid transport system substrate-binding protein
MLFFEPDKEWFIIEQEKIGKMKMKRYSLQITLVLLVLLLPACQPAGEATTSPVEALSEIQARGTLIVSIDPAYPPQSEIKPDATRAPDTKCALEQLTSTELQGFDVDVALEIAKRLGVEACFVTPEWLQVVRGDWQGQWDLSVGSMAITPERIRTLSFTQPYYATPASFFVHSDNASFADPGDLSGKKVGTCTGCTYQSYLEGTLSIPGEQIELAVQNAEIVEYATEALAIQELAWGDGVRLDAVLVAAPTGEKAISDGVTIKPLGEPVYMEYLAAAVDKDPDVDATAFIAKVTEIIQGMHADGVLRRLSIQYYNEDLTTTAANFDMALLK